MDLFDMIDTGDLDAVWVTTVGEAPPLPESTQDGFAPFLRTGYHASRLEGPSARQAMTALREAFDEHRKAGSTDAGAGGLEDMVELSCSTVSEPDDKALLFGYQMMPLSDDRGVEYDVYCFVAARPRDRQEFLEEVEADPARVTTVWMRG